MLFSCLSLLPVALFSCWMSSLCRYYPFVFCVYLFLCCSAQTVHSNNVDVFMGRLVCKCVNGDVAAEQDVLSQLSG